MPKSPLLNKPVSKLSKINAFGRWTPKHVWPRHIVPGFAPSYPTYAQLQGDGTGLTEDDFQAVGSSWLVEQRVGILADDMGLGKCKETLDAVMHVARKPNVMDVIILCEASNIDTWMDELQKWYPNVRRFAYRGPKRRDQFDNFMDTCSPVAFVVMSYSIFRSDYEGLTRYPWDWAILDEGHVIRGNPLNGNQSQIGELIHRLKPPRRHILSGTPIINTPADWWNIGRWLGVEDRSWSKFEADTLVIVPIQVSKWKIQKKIVGEVPAGVAEMRSKLERVMLRRTKAQVLKNLPSLRRTTRQVRMRPNEVKAYLAMAAAHKNAVEKLAKGDEPGINPQVAIMRMEQLTSSIESKIEAAMIMVDEATGTGQKVLIFTRHLQTLRMLYAALKKAKKKFVTIHGGVSTDAKPGEQSERGISVHRFQDDPDTNVLIGTAQACRTGLTLTAASLVILMDEEYSPKYVQQLIDRAHRIGQTNPVLVVRLEAVIQYGTKVKRTIEAQMQRMLQRKGDVADSIVQLSQFSHHDILAALQDDEFES